MKQFFKFVFASMVGFILAGVVLLIIIIGLIAGLVDSNSDKTVDVTPNSVLQIKLNYPITERTPHNPLAALGFLGVEGEKTMGLNDILANIKKAKKAPKPTKRIVEVSRDEKNRGIGDPRLTLSPLPTPLFDTTTPFIFVYLVETWP